MMKTILFAEDDPLIVQVYRGILERNGFQVTVAADGLEAMKMLLAVKPDVVLLDIMMPKVDGNYVLKYIRSEPGLQATRVIVLSGVSLADVAKDAIALKPDRVFLKSQSTPKRLLAAVNELLDARPTSKNPAVPPSA
jgi:CheY-like chemotaxis protein